MCDTMGKIGIGNSAVFAKNSDRSPNEPQIIEWYPAKIHEEKKVRTTYIDVSQMKETKSMILSRPAWMWGGEMGVNECGVCIGNEAVFTKGNYAKIGLTGMDMLRLALERAETAQDAVGHIIDLLERYGQGGNCGFDHDFYYDNGFLIMDKSELYILETAGKNWVYKKADQAAISNRLSIHGDGEVYSDEQCDFAKQYSDKLYSHFSQAAQRKAMCMASVETAENLSNMFSAMRQHADEEDPLCKASVGSPCMHFGGAVGDHTTQSMAVELKEDGQIHVWATGRSLPCISLFKPYAFGNDCVEPIYHSEDRESKRYWLNAEKFNRRLLGHKIPEEYYLERNSIEEELIQLSKNADAKAMHEISLRALEMESVFIEKWKKTELEKVKVSAQFKKNWEKKNKAMVWY